MLSLCLCRSELVLQCLFRAELEAAQTEVLEVKQLYVEMCQQKDKLQSDLTTQRATQDELVQVSLASQD